EDGALYRTSAWSQACPRADGSQSRRCECARACRKSDRSSLCLSLKSQIPDPKSRIPTTLKSFGFGFWDLGLGIYQLLFVTPVTSPSNASFRKQRRHIANFRM